MPRNKTKTEDAAPLAEPDAPTPETTPVADQSASETMAVAPPEEFDDDGATSTVDVARAVTFRLAGQLYGLRIEDIQEIQQIAELLPLPDSHPALVGLIEIRGRVVPAIDLRLLVGLEAAPYSLETPMIFCRVRDQLVCLIVDTVEDVVELPPEGIQPPSSLYALADRMLGTCKLAQGLALLLDVERLIPEAALTLGDAGGGGDR